MKAETKTLKSAMESGRMCVFGPRRFLISLRSLPQTVIAQSLQANIPQLG